MIRFTVLYGAFVVLVAMAYSHRISQLEGFQLDGDRVLSTKNLVLTRADDLWKSSVYLTQVVKDDVINKEEGYHCLSPTVSLPLEVELTNLKLGSSVEAQGDCYPQHKPFNLRLAECTKGIWSVAMDCYSACGICIGNAQYRKTACTASASDVCGHCTSLFRDIQAGELCGKCLTGRFSSFGEADYVQGNTTCSACDLCEESDQFISIGCSNTATSVCGSCSAQNRNGKTGATCGSCIDKYYSTISESDYDESTTQCSACLLCEGENEYRFSPCTKDTIDVCQSCDSVNRGSQVGTNCGQCLSGYYSTLGTSTDYLEGVTTCSDCLKCDDSANYLKVPCTHLNSECGTCNSLFRLGQAGTSCGKCITNYYSSSEALYNAGSVACSECNLCTGSGEYLSVPCSHTVTGVCGSCSSRNRVDASGNSCGSCRSAFFSSLGTTADYLQGSTVCTACTPCTSSATYQFAGCTSTSNYDCRTCNSLNRLGAAGASCGRCKDNHFSSIGTTADYDSGTTTCQECQSCGTAAYFPKTACTSTTNTVCELCSEVFRGGKIGTICGQCLSGYYHPDGEANFIEGVTACKACNLCSTKTEYLKMPCTNTQTSTCASCSSLNRAGQVGNSCGSCKEEYYSVAGTETDWSAGSTHCNACNGCDEVTVALESPCTHTDLDLCVSCHFLNRMDKEGVLCGQCDSLHYSSVGTEEDYLQGSTECIGCSVCGSNYFATTRCDATCSSLNRNNLSGNSCGECMSGYFHVTEGNGGTSPCESCATVYYRESSANPTTCGDCIAASYPDEQPVGYPLTACSKCQCEWSNYYPIPEKCRDPWENFLNCQSCNTHLNRYGGDGHHCGGCRNGATDTGPNTDCG